MRLRPSAPGGNFLMAGQTIKLFRQMPYQSPVWPSLTLEQWHEKGSPRAGDVLREYTAGLISRLEPPQDHVEILQKGREYIDRLSF